MPPHILDNRQATPAASVHPLLDQTGRAHFAAGCFFLNGCQAIANKLKRTHVRRWRIGNTASRPLEQLAAGQAARRIIRAQRRQPEFPR